MSRPQPVPPPSQTIFPDRITFRFLLVGLLLVAAWLRFQTLFSAGLHPDEALFASWARAIGTWQDPLLQAPGVDKPPLFFYLQAAFFPLLGTAEVWVVRLVNLLASLLLSPLVLRLVLTLYRERLPAFLAGALVIFSPLSVQYSSTAFLDPLLATLLTASLLVVVHPAVHPAGSSNGTKLVGGLLFGLAIATKYQAWLFLPLLLAMGLIGKWSLATWRVWAVGAGMPLLVLIGWAVARGGGSLWGLQMAAFGGLRPAWSWELWLRLETWGKLWATMLGSPVMTFLALLAVPIFFAVLLSEQDWPTAYDHLFVIFVAAYAILHWFVAVPIWDRYLLPVVPLVALVFGRFVSRVLTFLAPELPVPLGLLQRAAAIGAIVLLLVPAVSPAEAGDQQTRSGGINAVADLLADEPDGTVLYDHWYSWQWRYFLFDSGVYVSWFPHPDALVEDLGVFSGGDEQRYLALPADERALPVHRALSVAGYTLRPEHIGAGVALFRIEGGPG